MEIIINIVMFSIITRLIIMIRMVNQIVQGLTKPRQMLVVKDSCMAAIEYFTEPGISHF